MIINVYNECLYNRLNFYTGFSFCFFSGFFAILTLWSLNNNNNNYWKPTRFPDWKKNLCWLFERRASLGIMGTQLRAPISLSTIVLWYRGMGLMRALNLSPRMPRDRSLSGNYASDRCSFSCLAKGKKSHMENVLENFPRKTKQWK